MSPKSPKTSSIFEGLELEKKIRELETLSGAPGFWGDPEKAEAVLKRLKFHTRLQETWRGMRQKKEDIEGLMEIINPDNKEESTAVEKEKETLEREWNKAHVELFLNGPYDQSDALLIVSAGTGGVEAQDWAEMLLRMYLRYAESREWQVGLVEKQSGQEAGIKSATIEVHGPLAYGYLKAEHGVHRLVRLSPFNAKNLRQTSFALVETLPILPKDAAIEISEKDLRMDTFRSSGAGGQHVNKTESAVRITHIPTGFTVACQTERSQAQNRAKAMAVLKARLLQRMLAEKKEKIEELKGGYKEAAWGNQIRSYVFQPYTLVKDHRTDTETTQVHKVMDGDLDLFIEAYLLAGSSEPLAVSQKDQK